MRDIQGTDRRPDGRSRRKPLRQGHLPEGSPIGRAVPRGLTTRARQPTGDPNGRGTPQDSRIMDAKLNIVPFVSVDHMMTLVNTIGVERFLTELSAYIEEDFRRWQLSTRPPRRLPQHGRRHRADADERRPALRLQIRQRPPKNTREGRRR